MPSKKNQPLPWGDIVLEETPAQKRKEHKRIYKALKRQLDEEEYMADALAAVETYTKEVQGQIRRGYSE
jgi:hypothetical protein